MKIWIFTTCHNEEAIAPWFLRHYGAFADRILVWDDQSTDRTREILRAHPSVALFDWPHPTGIHEDINLHHWYDVYPSAIIKADWVMVVDMDEFIYHPRLKEILFYGFDPVAEPWRLETFTSFSNQLEVLTTAGFNMLGDGLPVNGYDHKQIWEHMPMGVRAPIYSKPVVFRPEVKMRWVRGRHQLENVTPNGFNKAPMLKLLHYRYLGADYTRRKNERNYNRCGGATGDKTAAWTCAPGYDGIDKEGSPSWAEHAKSLAFNVIDTQI